MKKRRNWHRHDYSEEEDGKVSKYFYKEAQFVKIFPVLFMVNSFFSGLKIGIFTTQQRLKNFGLHNKQNLKKPAETYIMKRDKDTKHEISNILFIGISILQ